MIVWLYEFLGRLLGKDDGKRRTSMCQQRGRALSIFDDVKTQLGKAKESLSGEMELCEARVAKKRVELSNETVAAAELNVEQQKIDATVANIDKMLGIENVEKVDTKEERD